MAIVSGSQFGSVRRQGSIPVNIKLILDTMKRDKPYMLGKTEFDSITLVAHITEYNESMGSIEILLMDDTGTIRAKIFKKAGSTLIKPLINYEHVHNGYVYVIGTLMSFDGNNIVVVTRMTNVEKYEFVLMHRTQVMWAFHVRNSNAHAISNERILGNLAEKFTEAEEVDDLKGLNAEQKNICKLVKSSSFQGMNKTLIYKSAGYPVEKINHILSQLVQFGFLYSDQDCEVYYYS